MTGSPIEEYLRALRAELTLPTRLRDRVLAEASDHLQLAAEQLDPQGAGTSAQAQRTATIQFGSPRQVARRFAQELATDNAHRATRAVSLATIAFCALVGLWQHSLASRGGLNLAAPFAVQIALTCAALSFTRCVRHRDDRTVTAGKLRWILRGDAVALGVILVSLGAELIAVAAHADWAARWPTSAVVGTAAAGVLALLALGQLISGDARLRRLAGFGEERDERDELADDLVVLAGQARTWARWHPQLAGPVGVFEKVEAAARAMHVPPELPRGLNLRTHPWRVGALVALAAGICAGLGHGLSEGAPPLSKLPGALEAFGAIAGLEALAVIACFALLGPFLGIRRPTRERHLSATQR
ncbi:MAG: HAAS signaling domain-containing protein [Solirubrobacteraceae bacterium]